MFEKQALILLIVGQFLLCSVCGKCSFGVGQRIVGDQLLLKDVQHSRPASSSQQPSVVFNYEIAEPITNIEIVSEENISAEVKFSYVNQLVVGMVTAIEQENGTAEWLNSGAFDVLISIYGFNDTILNVNPALLLNRDQQFEGQMIVDEEEEYVEASEEATTAYGNLKSDIIEVVEDDEAETHVDAARTGSADFEGKDKIIEIGHRQLDDCLIYETYQTTKDVAASGNQTVVFYYIDSDFITYVKFVIFDHFTDNRSTDPDYVAPVAEYSHYSPNTLKAIITDFGSSSLFVQMFIYGYRAAEPHENYEPFLPPPHWHRQQQQQPLLTPLQRLQLLMLTNTVTTERPSMANDDGADDKETMDDSERTATDLILPSARTVDQASVPNAALEQTDRLTWSLLGLLLLLLHS